MQWKWKACCGSKSVCCPQTLIFSDETHVANSPCNSTFFTCACCLIGLAVDAQVHDVVTADGAVVDDNVPCPEGDGVPL
jgi:hypothetical protein